MGERQFAIQGCDRARIQNNPNRVKVINNLIRFRYVNHSDEPLRRKSCSVDEVNDFRLISIAQQSNLLGLFCILARFLLYWCEPGFSPQHNVGFVRFLVSLVCK